MHVISPVNTLYDVWALNSNRIYIILVAFLSILFWIVFKVIYPFPFITLDSYNYVWAAAKNLDVSFWPIGYSKFIRMIGWFSHSSTTLVTVQYFLLQFSFLFFFLVIRSIFIIKSYLSWLLFAFLFLNPLFIFASNHIMSDVLFTAISFLWLVHLVWIFIRPSYYLLVGQAILLLIAFSIRYTALYYPFIAILVLIFSNQHYRNKILGIGLTLFFLLFFVQYTRIKMGEVTGHRQFSTSGGWKLASNALYMYGHLAPLDNSAVPKEFSVIHQITKNYFRGPHTQVDLYHIDQEFTTGSFYVAAVESPLMKYVRLKKGEKIYDFQNMAPFGAFFSAYGSYLIVKHPLDFLNYVIVPGIVAYLSPFPEIYIEHLDLNNIWGNPLGEEIKRWFGFRSMNFSQDALTIRGLVLAPFPFIFSLIHVGFCLILLVIILCGIFNTFSYSPRYVLFLMILLCVISFFFTILSATSVLRFQFNVIQIELTVIIIIINTLINRGFFKYS